MARMKAAYSRAEKSRMGPVVPCFVSRTPMLPRGAADGLPDVLG